MSNNNIGRLTTPSGEGASITVYPEGNLITIDGGLRFINNHEFITCDDTCYSLVLHSSVTNNTGAFIQLHNRNRSTYPGEVRFCTCNEDGSNTLFRACTDGKLLWGGRNLEGIFSKGSNYIKYTNGLCFNFGRKVIPANSYSTSITFSQSYIEDQLPIANVTLASDYINSTEFKLSTTITSTQLTIYCTSNGLYNMDRSINYFVIGYWK